MSLFRDGGCVDMLALVFERRDPRWLSPLGGLGLSGDERSGVREVDKGVTSDGSANGDTGTRPPSRCDITDAESNRDRPPPTVPADYKTEKREAKCFQVFVR